MNVTKLTAQLNIPRAVREEFCLDSLQQLGSLEQKSHSSGLGDIALALKRNSRVIGRC